MPTHKTTNEFIRKYNKTFAIKGYSKLPISEKIALVRKHVDKIGGAMKTEWDGIMGSSKTKVPKGSHKMPDGSIMKDSAMKKKPVYKLKSPRPVGAVARPNRTKRPGAPHSGALGGLTESKFKSTPKYTLAQKGPSAIKMARKPPSSTMKIVKATSTINTPKAPPPAPTRIGATGRPMKGGRSVDSVLRGRARARANKPTTTQALLKMPQDVGNLISAAVANRPTTTKALLKMPQDVGNLISAEVERTRKSRAMASQQYDMVVKRIDELMELADNGFGSAREYFGQAGELLNSLAELAALSRGSQGDVYGPRPGNDIKVVGVVPDIPFNKFVNNSNFNITQRNKLISLFKKIVLMLAKQKTSAPLSKGGGVVGGALKTLLAPTAGRGGAAGRARKEYKYVLTVLKEAVRASTVDEKSIRTVPYPWKGYLEG